MTAKNKSEINFFDTEIENEVEFDRHGFQKLKKKEKVKRKKDNQD